MISYLLIISELIFLYGLSVFFGRAFSRLVYRFSSSQKLLVILYSIIFLPGTIVHELSHFLVAAVLGVHIANLSILPEISEEKVTLGTLGIAQTDLFRRAFIGLAPLFIGTAAIIGGLSYLAGSDFTLPLWQDFLILYLVFQVSNTMFSSPQDLETLPELLVLIFVLTLLAVLLAYFFHINVAAFLASFLLTPQALRNVDKVVVFLLPPIAINVIAVSGLSWLSKIGRR